MLLGIWKNYEELEETISLDELNAILAAGRERDMRHWKFQASLKGIKIDDEETDNQPLETGEEALERIKRRAALKAHGVDETKARREMEREDLSELGIDFDFVEG